MPPIRRRDYLSIRNYDTFNNTIYWNINVVCHLIAESAITIKTAIPLQYVMKRSQILQVEKLNFAFTQIRTTQIRHVADFEFKGTHELSCNMFIFICRKAPHTLLRLVIETLSNICFLTWKECIHETNCKLCHCNKTRNYHNGFLQFCSSKPSLGSIKL